MGGVERLEMAAVNRFDSILPADVAARFPAAPPHMQPDLHFDDDLGDMVGQRQGDPAGPPVPGWAGMDYLLRSGRVDPGRTDRIDRHGVGCGLDLPLRAAQPG